MPLAAPWPTPRTQWPDITDRLFRPGARPFTERTPRVVAARRLTKRSRRDADGLFLAEGPQAVREALRRGPSAPGGVQILFATAEAMRQYPDLLAAASEAGVEVAEVTPAGMAGLSETVTPQGLVAVCSLLDTELGSVLDPAPGLMVVLHEANDPGNAGTVLRTADAAGAGAVVFADGSVDPYNGKCVRASAGSLFHPRIVRGGDVAEMIGQLQRAGLRVLAADGNGSADLDDELDSGRLAVPTAWMFGNEARGLPAEVAALADARVRIALRGGAESLNLAAAAAVCLFSSARARRALR